MDFRTIVQIPRSDFLIDHKTRLMLFGSCFSENIGKKLIDNKFSVDVNPFGVSYNPASISASIRRLLNKDSFSESDIVYHNNLYQSFMHHGSFSHIDKQECLTQISDRFFSASKGIRNADVLLITFGTASVFLLKSNGRIVNNCHKFPADTFVRKRLSVNEIVDDWSSLLSELFAVNPDLKVVFTVSPIRHFKDGAHENQLNKATLHLAIAQIEEKFQNVAHYFPAYELVMDELRDYRFYASDMIHLSDAAVDYIWKRFSETYFSEETFEIMREWGSIKRALEHRPLYGFTGNHFDFLNKTREKLTDFSQKYPFISCETEIEKLTRIIESNNLI